VHDEGSVVTSALLASAVALALMAHLAWLTRANRNKAIAARAADASSIAAVINHTIEISNGAVGVVTWAGSWNGERVQVRTIVDTLAVRKLPVRWLSVSITEKVDLAGTFDMMMRPGAPTTFSNFDHLEHTLPKVAGFPAEAVVRTDRKGVRFPSETIAGHLDVFSDGRAKELLITPNGIRIVWLLAEADRARYGVFRQAEFGNAAIDPTLVERLLRSAAALRKAINRTQRQAA
jgi:hypothetical protein